MSPDARTYLTDVKGAANLIGIFTAGRNLNDYSGDPLVRSATERQFEIIGEAISRLAKHDPTTVSRISEYQRIVAFRNFLIHQYSSVDDELVWNTLQTKLPTLSFEVQTLLEETPVLPK